MGAHSAAISVDETKNFEKRDRPAEKKGKLPAPAKKNGSGSALPALLKETVRRPREALSWVRLAQHEHSIGMVDECIVHLDKAFQLAPAGMDICLLLSDILSDQHNYKEASSVLNRLDSGVPRTARWHLSKARSHNGAFEFREGVESYYAAIENAPGQARIAKAAFNGMGACFMKLGMHAESALCYRTLLEQDEYDLGAAISAAHATSWICDWAALEGDFSRLAACIDRSSSDESRVVVDSVNSFPMITLTDDPAVHHWTSRMTAKLYLSDFKIRPHCCSDPVPRVNEKIRLGLLSSDFHGHATLILMIEALESIDPDIFELWIYSGGPDDGSALRARARQAATGWRETAELSSERLAELIKEDRIGILVEMKGYTLGSRIGVLPYRPAPIQVSWLGYPGTTGATCIDYFIGDPVVTPLADQPYFSERIAQMPRCYQPNDSHRNRPQAVGRQECGLPAEATFVFASFNQQYKIVPEVFAAWCRILLSVPGAVLWLLVRHEAAQQNLLDAAVSHGVSPDRIVFAPFIGVESHRRRLPLADLCLDTFPCGGHTTASDALWAGVPVLALTGRSFASRVAASLLHTLGLPELVCADIDHYVAEAIRLATEPLACTELRQRLATALVESPLFDGRRFAHDLERLLMRMVERQDAGLPPTPLAAEQELS
jgi:predicted O-linked N-acetylglucosamine transferase (SPINDLY family)